VKSLATAVVAVYNEERRLAECLASLLAQSYQPMEIVVVDDGSTDGTAALAARFPTVRLLRQAHLGKARAVNLAAEHARGEILLFLDGDMYFDSHYVEMLVAPILEGTAFATCHAVEKVANPDNVWSRCWQARAGLPADQRIRVSDENMALGSSIYRALRREDFRRVGGFDDTGHTDDHTLFPKLGRRATFIREAVCYHYNVESLSEVFSQGIWGGKSMHRDHGARALVSLFPPRALFRGCVHAWRLRNPAVALYDLVSDTGAFWGAARRVLHIDRTYAR
jgi:glycosyltransferase involved in cell wall biosynthesis